MKKIIVGFLLSTNIVLGQLKHDTIKVNGGNWIEILKSVSYYVDPTNKKTEQEIAKKIPLFTKNYSNLISLKRQPNNLWVHLIFKNMGDKQAYWLSLYSQTDTLIVYDRKSEDLPFEFKSISDYSKPSLKRNKYNIRFHYSSFLLDQNETVEVLLLIKNRRHFTNFYMDFTTPIDNLNWEKGFYWLINGFISIFFFIALLSFIFSILSRKVIFLYYTIYLMLTSLFILHEELFISVFETRWIYEILYKTNSIFLMLIAVGLNIQIFIHLTNTKGNYPKIHFYFNIFSWFTIVFGCIASFIYFMFSSLNFLNQFYNFIWYKSIILSVLCVIINSILIFIYFKKNKLLFIGILFGVLLLIFNPVVYYFNYSKIIYFYEIKHPNYYYYIIIIEIISLSFFIILQYQKKVKESIRLIKEKNRIENKLITEREALNKDLNKAVIETQTHLLANLSKDLHDDLGQKLSVINFSLENLKLKNESDELKELKEMTVEVSNSIRDLSHWLDHFEFEKKTLTDIIKQDIIRLNKVLPVAIHFQNEDTSKLSLSEKIILFRIYQELMNNSLKHSKPTLIEVKLSNTTFEFSDDGKNRIENKNPEGIGLKNIYERIATINWSYQTQTSSINNIIIFKKYD